MCFPRLPRCAACKRPFHPADDDDAVCSECEPKPEAAPFACPNCSRSCEPKDIIDKDGKEYCPKCVPEDEPEPEPFRVSESASEPCDPEDIIDDGGEPHCPKCWEPEPQSDRPAPEPQPFTCPNCAREMHPADVMPGPDGKDYCAACYPEEESEDDEDYAAPGFSAPKPVKRNVNASLASERWSSNTKTTNTSSVLARSVVRDAPSSAAPPARAASRRARRRPRARRRRGHPPTSRVRSTIHARRSRARRTRMIIVHPRPSAVVSIIEVAFGRRRRLEAAIIHHPSPPFPVASPPHIAPHARLFFPSLDPRLASRSLSRARRNLPAQASTASIQRGTTVRFARDAIARRHSPARDAARRARRRFANRARRDVDSARGVDAAVTRDDARVASIIGWNSARAEQFARDRPFASVMATALTPRDSNAGAVKTTETISLAEKPSEGRESGRGKRRVSFKTMDDLSRLEADAGAGTPSGGKTVSRGTVRAATTRLAQLKAARAAAAAAAAAAGEPAGAFEPRESPRAPKLRTRTGRAVHARRVRDSRQSSGNHETKEFERYERVERKRTARGGDGERGEHRGDAEDSPASGRLNGSRGSNANPFSVNVGTFDGPRPMFRPSTAVPARAAAGMETPNGTKRERSTVGRRGAARSRALAMMMNAEYPEGLPEETRGVSHFGASQRDEPPLMDFDGEMDMDVDLFDARAQRLERRISRAADAAQAHDGGRSAASVCAQRWNVASRSRWLVYGE